MTEEKTMDEDTRYMNGIYVSVENDTVHILQLHQGEVIQLADSSFADEVISVLEGDTSAYEQLCDYISESSELGEGENFGTILPEQVEKIVNMGLETALEVMKNNPVMGELLFADILNGTRIPDDGTANYYLHLMNHVNSILYEPLRFCNLMFCILYANSEYENIQEWFDRYVLKEPSLFARQYQFQIVANDTGLSHVYFFTHFSDYYAFMLLHFANEKKRVLVCQCCGNFFVPKNKNNTLYCDRVLSKYNKTCKKIAPKRMAKLKQKGDSMLAEYNRIKNRNYKRAERTYLKDNDKTNGKSLTFEQYEAWYWHVNIARKLYLLGKIDAEQFREIIYEIE